MGEIYDKEKKQGRYARISFVFTLYDLKLYTVFCDPHAVRV